MFGELVCKEQTCVGAASGGTMFFCEISGDWRLLERSNRVCCSMDVGVGEG